MKTLKSNPNNINTLPKYMPNSGEREAVIRTYAEHADDGAEVLQMLEHVTDEAPVNLS